MNKKSLKALEFDKIKENIKVYTETPVAKEIVDSLKPYSNIYDVEEHLKETDEALRLLAIKGEPPFEGIYDVRNSISRVEKQALLMPDQLLKIAQMLRCARRFKGYIRYDGDDEHLFPIMEDICEGIVPLKRLEDDIFKSIIKEDEISDKASNTLFNIRKSLKDKDLSIKDKVNSLVKRYSKYLQEDLYTIRGERYVLPVKAEHKGAVPGLIHDQSSSGSTLFIEPMSLVNLNNEIKELMLKERAEIERILYELSMKVYSHVEVVKNNADILWELDFIFSKAKYGKSINAICPNVNDEGIIDIIEGRHPLINSKEVVPISAYLGRDFTSLIITGPNTGGKTVTLKTIGLIEVMAMSGLLIPAKGNSTISLFNEVFADIGDEQSIEQSLSTFSSHMKNMVSIMETADDKTLVLLDELGAGTDPTEGAALAIAILENLRKRNTKVVATTHYSELKVYALKTNGVENASVEFDVETLRPTYRLLIGLPGKSNAFEISNRLGLPNYIIEDAKENISSDILRFEDLIKSLQDKNFKAARYARENESFKIKSQKLKEEYEEKVYKLEKSREKFLIEAQKDAKRIVREAKEEADEILKNIRKLERMGYSTEVRQTLEKEQKKLKDKISKIDEDSKDIRVKEKGEELENVSVGQEVYIPSLSQNGIVLTLPDSKGEVQIQSGIMKVNISLKELRESKSSGNVKKGIKNKGIELNFKSVSSSIDLRGMDSIEANYATDKYLDDAYMAGLSEVSIIHGKGGGTLRQSIGDMLKKHPHVKSYRLGKYGEGGTGVTIVNIG